MPTQMVRINERSHRTLRSLAKEQHTSMTNVLDRAVEHYRRRRLLESINADFENLRREDQQWRYELEERAEWDRTVGDDQGENA